MAVETKLFPLYEIAGGCYHITVEEPQPRPIADYIKKQKRFSHWKASQVDVLQNEVTEAYNQLKEKAIIAK
jgi:pyruvate/2-oxoacid:ferredoxin oxidoreductase beta subunit